MDPTLGPTQIIEKIRQRADEQKTIEDNQFFHRNIFLDLKRFMAQTVATILQTIKAHTYTVTVANQIKLPEVQKVTGSVSLKDIETIVIGLNEVVKELRLVRSMNEANTKSLSNELKPEKTDFTSLEEAVKAIKIPEVTIPNPQKEVTITNLDELKKPIADLAKKLSIKVEAPAISLPPQPKTITVGNLEGMEGSLEAINTTLTKQEEKPIGFSFEKDSTGKLKTLTEIYPSGKVVSKGWNLGSVKIEDDRTSQ